MVSACRSLPPPFVSPPALDVLLFNGHARLFLQLSVQRGHPSLRGARLGPIFPWASFLTSIGNPSVAKHFLSVTVIGPCVTECNYTFTGVLLLLESQGPISLDLHGIHRTQYVDGV